MSRELADQILLRNGLMTINSSFAYGIYYKGVLIKIMYISPSKSSKYQWEIFKIISDNSYDLSNWFDTIFEVFKKEYNPVSLICRDKLDESDKENMLRCGFIENKEDVLSWFAGGVVYKMTLPDGYFYIGSTVQDLNKYNGSGCEWNRHIVENGYKPEDIKKEVLKDDFKTEHEMRSFEVKQIRKFLIEDELGYITKVDEKCLNNSYVTRNISSLKICNKCGGKNGHHKLGCPDYIPNSLCSECGSATTHEEWCSRYKEKKVCEECGGRNGKHKKSCSRYVDAKPCPECGRKYGHKKGCMYYKPSEVTCSECGGKAGKHRIGCSEYNDRGTCSECGGRDGKHTSSCSKYKRPICPECGGVGRHYKTCSKYNELSKCSECGGKNGHHYKSCSKFKTRHVCLECGGKNGHHKKSCSSIAARTTNRG